MSVQKYNSRTRVNNEIIPYTQINTNVIQNIDNIEAGFIWVYLQSKPETWDVIKEHIKKKYKLGNGKIKSIFSYLVKHKLIKNNPIRTEDGKKISHHDIIVLNGEDFIKEPEIKQKKLSTKQKSTGSIINPLDYQPASFQPTINNRYTNKEKIKIKKRDALSDFLPNEENVNLAKTLNIDFYKELESFNNRHKGKKTQYEFARWLKSANEYANIKKQTKIVTNNNQTQCTLKFYAAGHPDFDRVNGIK
jgi:hypothetical protein